MKIGVLAVQGAFIEHERIIQKLGYECIELRIKSDLQEIDGIILPGGESTVQGKLLRELDLFDSLKEKIASGIPVLATCAGLILLSEEIENDDNRYFGTLPVTVRRNAYGRQLGSFETTQHLEGFGSFPMTFIRAPYIVSVRDGVNVLGTVDDKIVAVQYQNQIGLAFHPELGGDDRIHRYFVELVEEWKASK